MKYIVFLWMVLLLPACTFKMNFTGGNVDTNLKTLTVTQFNNESPLVVAYHAQRFTEQLKDRFQAQTRLTLVNVNGDVELSGSIVNYTISSIAVAGTAQSGATQNRMTIGVKVKYENKINPNENWEQTFSSYFDFPAGESLSAVERTYIEKVNDQITQDIFNKSLGKW